MNTSVLAYVATHVDEDEIRSKDVLEVGAQDLNGSVAPILRRWGAPKRYVGVDLEPGPGVDVVCPAEELIERFGRESFDLVLSTELIEHVRDWRAVISNLKGVCRRGGTILVTTRSRGFKYHAYPHDFWRYEPEDMAAIFCDCKILSLETDPLDPGVFCKARKPLDFQESDLSDIALHTMLTGSRKLAIEPEDYRHPHFQRLMVKGRRRAWRKRLRKRLRGLWRAP